MKSAYFKSYICFLGVLTNITPGSLTKKHVTRNWKLCHFNVIVLRLVTMGLWWLPKWWQHPNGREIICFAHLYFSILWIFNNLLSKIVRLQNNSKTKKHQSFLYSYVDYSKTVYLDSPHGFCSDFSTTLALR